MDILRFQPLSSAVDTSFWAELQNLKLGLLRLSERPLPLQGWLTPSVSPSLDPTLRLDQTSFATGGGHKASTHNEVRQEGTIVNVNSHDSFKAFEAAAARREVVHSAAAQIWKAIQGQTAFADTCSFNHFVLLTYADLKRYHFTYWFAFVALEPPSPIHSLPAVSLEEYLGKQQAVQVASVCRGLGPRQPFWLLHVRSGREPEVHSLDKWQQLLDAHGEDGTAALSDAEDVPTSVLSQAGSEIMLAWADPGSAADHPAWPLRNTLLAAAVVLQLRRLRVVCARTRGADVSTSASLVLDVSLPEVPPGWCCGDQETPKARGWEIGMHNKAGPRQVDLAAAMDPERLMDAAVDLNLKLMLWRAAPTLDLSALSATRCLLLGAGTLGCAVARTLLGWGVRHITFLDSGRVSYSNPVRQSLFELSDCSGQGRPKAQAAADALRRIFPSVVTQGVQLMVPMPGHPIAHSEEAAVHADAAALERLIRDHDVVFLLMDTREARWLPSLLCASAGKLAINAALGFDSYLVMRHGGPPLPPREQSDLGTDGTDACTSDVEPPSSQHPESLEAEEAQPAALSKTAASAADCSGDRPRVGCYFCQDVVAPGDSTVGRALDQQCTVARPGLAPIAGALAVEMMSAVVQERAAGSTEALGAAAHMVRGQLATAEQTVLQGAAFPQCTACSAVVVTGLREGGWPWLLAALRDPKRLEDLTGLTEMHKAMDQLDDFAVESDEDTDTANIEAWTSV